MKTSITLLMLFVFLPIFSQEMETYKISVQEVTSVKGENKKIYLLKNKEENLIIFQNQKEQRLSLNEKDSLRVMTLLKKNDQESKDELFSIIEQNKVFEIDSLQISKRDPIFKITDSFFKNRKKLKRQAEEIEDKRIILDGTIYTITIVDLKGESFTFYAHSPTKESHPEVFKLISALQDTYSQQKN